MKRKNKKEEEKLYPVMIGGGDQSIIIHVKKGTKVYIGDGHFQEAGLTLEESRRRLDERWEESCKKWDEFNKRLEKEEKRDKRKQKIKSIFNRNN